MMKTIDELGISQTPWRVDSSEFGDVNQVVCNYAIGRTRVLARTNYHFNNSLADARLIAAAPELYDALYRIVSAADDSVGDFDKWRENLHAALRDARKALAKASGEEADVKITREDFR